MPERGPEFKKDGGHGRKIFQRVYIALVSAGKAHTCSRSLDLDVLRYVYVHTCIYM